MEEINIFGKKYNILIQQIILCDCQINKIPKEIGQLINLQELDISGNNIREIPKYWTINRFTILVD